MNEPKKQRLSDILRAANRNGDNEKWADAKPAQDLTPVPRGEYVALAERGEMFSALTGTIGYKIIFRILEGEFTGRLLWHPVWLTGDAASVAKRDFGKLGIPIQPTLADQAEYLESHPLPKGIVCKLRVVIRTNDDRSERNEIRQIDVLRIEKPKADPFDTDEGGPKGDAGEPPTGNGLLFDPDKTSDSPGPYREGI